MKISFIQPSRNKARDNDYDSSQFKNTKSFINLSSRTM